MNFYRGHIPISEPLGGVLNGRKPCRDHQTMLLKNSISLESGVRVTIAFLLLAV